MNKQLKTATDKATGQVVIIGRGIEWTDYTWNVLGGCEHDCEWIMPDGTLVECYAKTVAERVARDAYPQGFKHHYYHPERLPEPFGLNNKLGREGIATVPVAVEGVSPSTSESGAGRDGQRAGRPRSPLIFLDSMSDLFGHWVPKEQIEAVLDTVRNTPHLIYQSLTKNAPRLLQFNLPGNLWPGVSAPPSRFMGKELTLDQQKAFVFRQLDVLQAVLERKEGLNTWMSIEPLSFDIADVFEHWLHSRTGSGGLPLKWAVIGAASNGAKLYQPAQGHVGDCHRVLRANNVKIFHKGNLKWEPHLEEFPA